MVFLTGMLGGAYWAMQSNKVQTYLTQQLAVQLSKKINASITIGKVDFTLFRNLILEDVLVEDQKADTLFFAATISAQIDSLKIRKRRAALNRLTFQQSRINIDRDSANRFNFSFILDSLKIPRDEPGEWQFTCNRFNFSDSRILYDDSSRQEKRSFAMNDLNFDISDLSLIEDSLHFNINQLSLNDGKNLNVSHFRTGFTSKGSRLELAGLDIKTDSSDISNSELIIEFPEEEGNSLETMQFDFRFSHSKISLSDVARLAPGIKGMDQVIDCSGQVVGNIDDIRGRDLVLQTGQSTSASLDFSASGISDPETMYLFFDLKESETTFKDLSRIKLPAKQAIPYLRFPEPFYDAGVISYQGNFTGFLTDFVAYGTLTSEMGVLNTDVSVIPESQRRIAYQGKVATEDFRLGELFKVSEVGEITFDGSVDGYFNQADNSVSGAFEGDIVRVDVNGYDYRNIRLDGLLNNRMFDGLISANDSNLQFDFLGKVNFNPEVPVFDFQLDLQKVMPGKLNLSKAYPDSEMSFFMNANFKGNQIDNLAGSIEVENGTYENRNGELNLEGFELRSIPGDPLNYLSFTSDFLDMEINGNYHFQNIVVALKKAMTRYLPAVNYNELAGAEENRFGYQVNVKDLDDVLTVFAPGYKVETPFLLYGRIDSEQSVFELKGSIPGLTTEKVMIKNIFIGNGPRDEIYTSRFRFGEILLRNGMKLENLTIDSEISDNIIYNQIDWANSNKQAYTGKIESRAVFSENGTASPLVEVEGIPSGVFMADTLWQISPFSATIDTSSVAIRDFSFSNNGHGINIDGKISEDDSDVLTVFFENIDLKTLGIYLDEELPLGGILNGSAEVQDFFGQRLVFSDMNIDNFNFKDQRIGDVSLVNQWDNTESVISSELLVTANNRKRLFASGSFNPRDNELLYHADFDHLSLVVLETLIRKNMSNFHGDASGNLKIHGTPQKVLMDGTLAGTNAGLTVDYTQVSYHFDDSVRFSGDTIRFDRISIRDNDGNRGTFNGTLVHDNFQDMQYDLTISSPKLIVMNTTPSNNPQFFGRVVANGRFSITGVGKQVDLRGSGATLAGTNVNISLENESEIERYDFIQFVSTEDTTRQQFLFPRDDDGEFTLNLTIHATPEARAQLIYNSQIGDVIKAQGEGILEFGMDNDNNITLSGNYTIEQGDYLFTLQNVINKRFTIEQGGTIDWSGDPYNATINISAVYKLKASLYDLLVNTYDNIYQNQRIPVESKILLSENLSNPAIDFDIEFPTVEDRLVDELRQFFNTSEEMNKQILSLVVLGKFYTPEYLRGTYEAQNPNLIGTTASELFSNQLSNWLSQINSNVDIGLNYRPGSQITNDEIELALSTQMFNDRVTVNGNIGNNSNPASTNNSQLVGDFEVNVKLIPSGKVQFKAYNRSNNNLIYETSPYTQGVGVSFTEDYNSFNDLYHKMKSIFIRKEEEE